MTGSFEIADDGGEDQAMRVLAIDTALEACSAAVLDTSSGITASETLAMTRGHAEAVMPLIARVMSAAAIEFADLDRIAVTTGPGSFTGLRVGISATRGIALAAGKPAVGLSTLAGFAAPLIADDDSTQVVAAIDARHEQVYLQVFGSGGRTLVTPRVASVRNACPGCVGARQGTPRPCIPEPSRLLGHPLWLLKKRRWSPPVTGAAPPPSPARTGESPRLSRAFAWDGMRARHYC